MVSKYMLRFILNNGEVSLHKVRRRNRRKNKTTMSTITREIQKIRKVTGNVHGCRVFNNNVDEHLYQVNRLKAKEVGGASAVDGASAVEVVKGRTGRGKGVRKGTMHKRETRGRAQLGRRVGSTRRNSILLK